ncbi:Ig-like domain-containing protein [Enterococcus caccae]|uniref:Serine protease n=1 Tax=Enterococcus caccae ATCC BAA-1240 TaxID=1158612 RepID=R3TZ52_9ENTE|nr:Ig-like domain-containing protein [Enterococcus caccae]EOL46448.1 hypothetical protein UC7_01415 [Enterococcus caccae ATCC BAA-1240]EOT60817.1 hypothetical protein I580_01717 [Enterococcus caccae ATCC BAA-1240]
MRKKKISWGILFSFFVGSLVFMNPQTTVAQSNYDFIEVDFKTREEKRVSFEEVMYEGMPETLDAYDPSNPTGRKIGIIGEDDRKRVEDPTLFPYSPISTVLTYRNAEGTGGAGQGSGVLIGKDTVLTCAHAVWSKENGFSKHTKVTPGRIGWNNLPFGETTVRKMYIMANYVEKSSTVDWDIAILKLDKSIGNHTGWLGVNYLENESDVFTLTGYPGEFSATMYTDSKTIPEFIDGKLAWGKDAVATKFDATGGNSGSPIYDSNKRVNAVMSTIYGTAGWAETVLSKGSRISKEKFAMIYQFVNEAAVASPEKVQILDKKELDKVLYKKPQIFQAKILPQEADQSIKWESADPSIASVDKTGKVTAHKVGRTVITARSEENPEVSDHFTVVTDDHSDYYSGEATAVLLGEEMTGYFDYDSSESIDLTGKYDGDQDVFLFTAPEDGEYSYYDYSAASQCMTRFMWFYDTGEKGWSNFGSFQTFSMKKGERLFIELEEFNLYGPRMNVGGKYNFIIDKKENVHLGNITIKDARNQVVTDQVLAGKIGDSIQLQHELVNTTILNPTYKNIFWKSNDESIATVDKNTGLVTVKKLGQATISAYNRYSFLWNYSNLEAKVHLTIK